MAIDRHRFLYASLVASLGGVAGCSASPDSESDDTSTPTATASLNRGRLQRAERPPSRDESAEYTLPLPPAAGGEYGQAAVYNTAVEYDPGEESWSVTDSSFDTEQALYLANQDIWIGHWGGEFFQGRGVPGKTDSPL